MRVIPAVHAITRFARILAIAATCFCVAQAARAQAPSDLTSVVGSTFLLEAESPEAVKAVTAQLSAETGSTVEATRIGGPETKNEDVIQALPAAPAALKPKFSWIGLSAHFEAGTRIVDGGGGVTFINNLFEVAGDIGIPSYGYSITLSPLAPIFRNSKVQPTLTRKFFVQGDLQGEEKRNTTTRAKLLYGVQVFPWGAKNWGFYGQAGRGTVETEYWERSGGQSTIRTDTRKRTVLIVGATRRW